MPATYGMLHLSIQGIIGFAVVAILTMIITTVSFRRGWVAAGWSFMAANILLFIATMNSMWAAILQHYPGLIPVFGALCGSIVAGAVWLVLTIYSLLPKQKVVKSH